MDEKKWRRKEAYAIQKSWPKWRAIVTYAMEGDCEQEKWFDNTLVILAMIQPYVMWNLFL